MRLLERICLCIAILITCFTGLVAQTQIWDWAYGAGDAGSDEGRSIATDHAGNTYVTGSFKYYATFGDITLINSSAAYTTIFVAKYDLNGNWIWAKSAGGSNNDYAYGITVDDSANVFITGTFVNSASFGTTTLTDSSSGDYAMFVAKLDSNGSWLWAKKAVSDWYGYVHGTSICAGSDGSAYVTGYYQYDALFGTNELRGSSRENLFIAKISSTGSWLWAKYRNSSGYARYSNGITVDAADNVYITGSRELVVKYSNAGTYLWSAGLVGNNTVGKAIAVDIAGNLYVTGVFYGLEEFGSSALTSYGGNDIFIIKLDNMGNINWVVQAGGIGDDKGYGITTDFNNNIYVTGYFCLSGTFGNDIRLSNGGSDIFIYKLDSGGNWIWTKTAGGTLDDIGYGIAEDTSNKIAITGSFQSSITFGELQLTSQGSTDIHVGRIAYLPIVANMVADPVTGLEDLAVQFTDLSQPGNGAIVEWAWDFGDGITSALQNPMHVYNSGGVYSVTLTITNSADSTASITMHDYITVIPRVPQLEIVTDAPLSFGNVYLGSTSTTQELWIKNIGWAALSLNAISNMLTMTPFSVMGFTLPLSIAEGDSAVIQIRFTPQIAGTIIDSLYIYNNSVNMPVAAIRLTGRGEIVPPKPPENVHIVMNGTNAVLSWDAVAFTIFDTPIAPDYYLIFNSSSPYGEFAFNGATRGMEYTHFMVGLFRPRMFYKVIAYKYFGRGVPNLDAIGIVPGMPEAEVIGLLQMQ